MGNLKGKAEFTIQNYSEERSYWLQNFKIEYVHSLCSVLVKIRRVLVEETTM